MEAVKMIAAALEELQEALAISDIMTSAFCEDGQEPSSMSVSRVMGTQYQHLKKAADQLEASMKAMRGNASGDQ